MRSVPVVLLVLVVKFGLIKDVVPFGWEADDAARVVSGVLCLYVSVDCLFLLDQLILGQLRERHLALQDSDPVLLEVALLLSVHVDARSVFFIVSVALRLVANGGYPLPRQQLVARVVRRTTDLRCLLYNDWQAS